MISMIITLGRTKRNNKAAKTQSSTANRNKMRCLESLLGKLQGVEHGVQQRTQMRKNKNTHVLKPVLLRDL